MCGGGGMGEGRGWGDGLFLGGGLGWWRYEEGEGVVLGVWGGVFGVGPTTHLWGQTDRQAGRQAGRQTEDRQAGRPAGRQTDRQAPTHPPVAGTGPCRG